MLKLGSVKSASGNGTVGVMSVDPTPQHHHKRIARVKHSGLAILCQQDVETGKQWEIFVSHDT